MRPVASGALPRLHADPMWDGAGRLPELNQAVAERWPRFHGPESGWPASWQTVLSVAYQSSRGNAARPAVTASADEGMAECGCADLRGRLAQGSHRRGVAAGR